MSKLDKFNLIFRTIVLLFTLNNSFFDTAWQFSIAQDTLTIPIIISFFSIEATAQRYHARLNINYKKFCNFFCWLLIIIASSSTFTIIKMSMGKIYLTIPHSKLFIMPSWILFTIELISIIIVSEYASTMKRALICHFIDKKGSK